MAAEPIALHAQPPATAASGARWGGPRRIAFRFAFAYWLLYLFPFTAGWLLSWLPGANPAMELWQDFWHGVVPWVGEHVLRLPYPITVFTNGSGDTTYDYVLVACLVALAALGTLIWSALDGRRGSYRALEEALRITLRYSFAVILLSYGFSKVFKLQFPAPSPGRLVQPYGESSPMGLLWTFMGASAPYTIFSGALEVAAGMLLLFRRTTTLGALVAASVMTNIVMLNLCYDVPVKLFSMHLLLMALLLLVPDAGRLASVLLLHRPTQPTSLEPPFAAGRLRHVRRVLKFALIGYLVYSNISGSLARRRQFGDNAPKIAVFGVYDVEQLERAGRAVAPGDAASWRRINVTNAGFSVTLRDGSTLRYNAKDDAAKKTLTISARPGERGQGGRLAYRLSGDSVAILEGSLDGDAVRLQLRKLDTSKSLLMNRGFRWINEYPFNR